MRIVKISSMEELQSALRKARGGDILTVQPGFQFNGAIILPNKHGDEIAIVSATGVKGETR